MENVKNRIITLSGQPATGKGTVKNILTQKYGDIGYEVKAFSTGDKFREYFNDIIELLIAVKNKDSARIEGLSQREGVKKVMYDSDGNLKSEAIQMINDTLQIVKEKNYNLDSFDIEEANNNESLFQIREALDFAIDSYIRNDLRKQINSKPNPKTIWIIDSRLAWHNIPKDESFSARLVSDEKVAGMRAYKRFLKMFDDFIKDIEQCIKLYATNIGESITYINSNWKSEKLSDKEKLQIKFDLLESIISTCPNESIKNEYLKKLMKVKEESYENVDKAVQKIVSRKQGEKDRYKSNYQLDLDDKTNYKLVVDTSNMTAEEVAALIFEAEQKSYSKEGYKDGENVGYDR